jgi:[acyl-carrier-protein] S-malonyltransferase
MGRELADAFGVARATFEEADAAIGEDLSRLIWEGPRDTLTLTANTQPSIVTVSIAALRAFQERSNLTPSFVAGHSLGEFSALVCAGAMSFTDAVRTTRARGAFMQEAVPPGKGAMAAVMKMSPNDVEAACGEGVSVGVVCAANFNSPDQTVISGAAGAVEHVSTIIKERGGRVIPLKVSAPFHCALMEPAATRLNGFLGEIDFSDPMPPVVTNVEAEPNVDGSRIRDLLVRQVTSPVRWTESVTFMIGQGVTRFVEFGPGNVLAGLITKIDSSIEVLSVNTPESLEKALESFSGAQK